MAGRGRPQDKKLKHEVRRAVQDYLSELIQSRTHHGGGMAVSHSDLMVAAKRAGKNATKSDADNILQRFVQPGMRMLKDTGTDPDPPGEAFPNVIPKPPSTKMRESVPGVVAQKKRERHWLEWKSTASTPVPDLVVQEELEALRYRPKTAADRPATAASLRPLTATKPKSLPPPTPLPPDFTDASVAALNIPTPEPFSSPAYTHKPGDDPMVELALRRAASALSRPTAPRPVSRAITPYRNPTPYEHPDPEHTPLPIPPQINSPALEKGLRVWISRASDYDRSVAYDLFKTINGGTSAKSGPRAPSAPPRQPTGPTRKLLSSRAGVRTSVPDFYSSAYPDLEDEYVRSATRLGDREPFNNGPRKYAYSRGRGKTRHNTLGYTHENSFFTNSQLPFRGHFDIAPDWVSEQVNYRKTMEQALANRGRYDTLAY